MSHQEAGGLVLLAALVLLIGWVAVLRVRQPGILPRAPRWTPETAMQTAGSPCPARDCPAYRYAPLDEHNLSAHLRGETR